MYSEDNPFSYWFWEVVWLLDGLPLSCAPLMYHEVDCRWAGDTGPMCYVAQVGIRNGQHYIQRYPILKVD